MLILLSRLIFLQITTVNFQTNFKEETLSYNAQIKESHQIEEGQSGSFFIYVLRILLGFTLMLAGFYAAVFGNFQGHELGFFLVFAAPLIIINGEENLQQDIF